MNKGYTLIEVMIALSVFAVIAALSSGVMYHVFDIRGRVAMQANQLGELQFALTLIEHDTIQFIPRTVRTKDAHVFSSFTGTHQYMEFTRGGQVNPKGLALRSTLKRVAFLCNHKQLIRRSWNVLDTLNRKDYEDKVLLSNLETCSFFYVSRNHQMMPEWRAYKIEQNQRMEFVPSAIQITINPAGWGKMTFLFVLAEGLYGA